MSVSGRFLTVLVIGLVLLLPTQAFAEVGIQLRVPYQGSTSDGKLASGASGTGVLIFFALDSTTSVGLLSEQISFTEKNIGSTADLTSNYNVNAIRISKNITDPTASGIDQYFAAVDIGNGQNAVANAPLADIVLGVHMMGTKGKMTSFFGGELMYRLFNPGKTMVAGGGATNYGGVGLCISAGFAF